MIIILMIKLYDDDDDDDDDYDHVIMTYQSEKMINIGLRYTHVGM